MISIRNLCFSYNDTAKPALRNVNLTVQDGEFILLTGPSGGGKSSLCRCLNGLIPHFYGGKISGEITVQGFNTLEHSTREMATEVGMVFQDPENQLVTLDTEREIAFGLENLAFPRMLIIKRMEESIDALGLSAIRRRALNELSGGEKQKVAIASVLALHPKILVLDEPTSELDPKGAEDVLATVGRLNEELGITVILVEHRLDRVVHLVDRMVVLNGGELVADDTPRKVMGGKQADDLGIGLPPIVRLFRGIQAESGNIGELPLTVKEGRAMLDKAFQKEKKHALPVEKRPIGKPIVTLSKLSHIYSNQVVALREVNLEFHEGEFTAIMGRNASGKTTLVKHINGLLKPTRGTIMVNGVDTEKSTIAALARTVGFIFQNPNDHLFADTVEEEVAFTLKSLGFPDDEVVRRSDEVLEQFNLAQYRYSYPRSLSGGERQRVALASVVAAGPKVLILDEPTRGMEYSLKNELMKFLKEYRDRGNTIILVTHDVETVAEHADRVVLLSEGRVVVDGDRRQVLSKALLFSPQINRLVQAFEKYDVPGDILTADEALEILR